MIGRNISKRLKLPSILFRSKLLRYDACNYSRRSFGDVDYVDRNDSGALGGFDNSKTPVWSNIELQPIEKEIVDTTERLPAAQVEEFRKSRDIRTSKSSPDPILNFEESAISRSAKDTLRKKGFKEPTSIQTQGWPILFNGSDLIAIAQTGSGKTLSFIIPALMHITKQKEIQPTEEYQPRGLVLAPTRELCRQIADEAKPFCSAAQVKYLAIYGGASRVPQIHGLKKGIDLIIATPGRLLDLLHEGHFNLQNTSFVVLDEADRCLDMGFEPQIREALSYARPDRQTVMFSATWPKEIQGLASEFLLPNHEKLFVGSTELSANKAIEQHIKVIQSDRDRLDAILEAVEQTTGTALIFCHSKARVDLLGETLSQRGLKCGTIHGGKSQQYREGVIDKLKRKRIDALVATDVAARGLDIDNVTLVINCDLPQNIDSYIHRIGRTGRQSKEGQRQGTSLSFYNARRDVGLLHDLKKVFQDADQYHNFPENLKNVQSRPSIDRNPHQKRPRWEFGKGQSNNWRPRFTRN